jgi:hypothetical protein
VKFTSEELQLLDNVRPVNKAYQTGDYDFLTEVWKVLTFFDKLMETLKNFLKIFFGVL